MFVETLDVEIYNRIDELPYFNIDLDKGVAPPPVVTFRKRIEEADGVIICTPEYVFSQYPIGRFSSFIAYLFLQLTGNKVNGKRYRIIY